MGGEGGMFSYADNIDKLLMLFGTLGSIGDGMTIPGVMFLLSGLIDTYGNLELRSSDISSANRTVDKYGLKLMYLATGVGISAFVEGVCRTRTAERQTSRIRMEYLGSTLVSLTAKILLPLRSKSYLASRLMRNQSKML